ncbi:MAG TPA: LytTR family DNA-binding domain-containing protein [Chryseolinea sp.]
MNAVVFWLRQPFNLLDTNVDRLKLVIFCGVFGCLFLIVFQPFNLNLGFSEVNAPLSIIFAFFTVAGMVALSLTQFAFRRLFNVRLTTRLSFLLWSLVEFFFIALAVHVIDILVLGRSFFDVNEFMLNLKHTSLVLVLPYFLGILLLHVQKQLQLVEELTVKINRAARNDDNVTINDEKGKAAMSIAVRNIVYVKSEDNYILLFHKHDQHLQKELIRTTLKRLEQELGLPNMIRIHRSYMINSQNLISAVKTPKGYKVKMGSDTAHHLPVSVTYQKAFEAKVVSI